MSSECSTTQRPVVSRLHCHAIASDPRRQRADPAARCDMLLGYTAEAVRFVDVARSAPAQPDGRHWVRCSRCKSWNIFEAVPQ